MTPEQLPLLRHVDFIPSVYNRKFWTALVEFARVQRRSISAHMKVDTGMRRLGLSLEEAKSLIVEENPYVKIDAVFTHLACAELLQDDYTLEQLRQFTDFVGQCKNQVSYIHAANSAAILNYPASHFNLVRPGLLLYGISPMGVSSSFQPILSLRSKIISLNRIRKGDTIGYGRTFRAERDSLIATIPVGYSDGLRRSLSNRLLVEVRGRLCRVAGTVSMDLCMVDVTELSGEVQLYDIVTLIGPRNTVWDWANLLDTIPYEITCLIGSRVPRVYYKNNQISEVYYP
jgi:alanine racemase